MCQGFSVFSGVLHYFVLANLATSSIRVKGGIEGQLSSWTTTKDLIFFASSTLKGDCNFSLDGH